MGNQTRVDLPAYVQHPYEVFVNGVSQTEGTDFERFGSTLLFDRSFVREPRMPWWRWALMSLGIAGAYHPHDTIDVVFTVRGRRSVASLTPRAPDESG